MELTQEQKDLLEKVRSTVSTEMEQRGYQTAEQMKAILTEQLKAPEFEGLRSLDFDGLRSAMEILHTKPWEQGKEEKPMSIRGQMAQYLHDNKEIIDAIKSGEMRTLPEMQLRVAGTMTNAASLGGSAFLPDAQVLPGVVDLVRVQPTFWNRLQKGRAKANPLVWVNKTNKQGNATFIGEGVLKNLASFELSTEQSNPKKVAERMKASTEILYDIDYMQTLIEQELRFEVETAANAAVLTGTLSSTSPAGITTIASAYVLTTIKTDNPTFADCVRAAIAQLRSLNFNGVLTAFINPIDAASMDLAKGSTGGAYLLPPFVTADGRIIAGVSVIEDNNIAVGKLLIGDMSKYKIVMHQDFFIRWGLDSDDFSKNLVTVIGEMRFHQYYSVNHTGAWIYDDFADIQALLTP